MKHLYFLNKQYFFLFILWLINKKMYKETFLIINIHLALIHTLYLLFRNHPQAMAIYLNGFIILHIFTSFIVNNLYYRKISNIFHNMPLSPTKENHINNISLFNKFKINKEYFHNFWLKTKYSLFPIKNKDNLYDIDMIDLKIKSFNIIPTLVFSSLAMYVGYYYTFILFKIVLFNF